MAVSYLLGFGWNKNTSHRKWCKKLPATLIKTLVAPSHSEDFCPKLLIFVACERFTYTLSF